MGSSRSYFVLGGKRIFHFVVGGGRGILCSVKIFAIFSLFASFGRTDADSRVVF